MFLELSGAPRLLIADDEPEIRDVLGEFLGGRYDCVCVGSAEEALERLQAEPFALVVSDITMTGLSGLEMLPRVRELAPEAVVVMLSGQQTLDSAVAALRAGAFDYLTKPFDLQHVGAAIDRALEHHELLHAQRRREAYLEQLVGLRTAALDRALEYLESAYRSTLLALTAALEARDRDTHGHSERVVSFSLRLGRELGLEREQMRSLEFGALLHDIGKLGIPDAILRKPARLSEDEWGKMRLHPLLGVRILRGIAFLDGASRVVGQHHERWDGSGYPLGLRGEEIDLNARIFAVADAFDAMTSDRVYRPGRVYEEASAEIEAHAGTQFDPRVVEAFARVPAEEWAAIRLQATCRAATHPGPLLEMNYTDPPPPDSGARPARLEV